MAVRFFKEMYSVFSKKTWMADVKLSNWNIATNSAILKEKNYKS